ncbi:MAG: OmpH family outer membrane protein [Bacteroidota bacterium]
MKKLFILFILSILASPVLMAQGKIGSFNLQEVLPKLTEYQKAQEEMETYAKQIRDEVQSQQEEFQKKLEILQQEAPNLAPSVLSSRQAELQTLQQEFEQFQQSAQTGAQQLESKLMTPILSKVQENVQKVADSNGYAYIVKSEYCSAEVKSNDITPLVLKSLGVN